MICTMNYKAIYEARRRLGKIMIMNYPEVLFVSDLPQELVYTFNVLTEILLDGPSGLTQDVSKFETWWDLRNIFMENWPDG